MADAVVGALAFLGADAPGTAVGSYTNMFEFVSESVKKQGVIRDTSGIRGTRSHASERTVADAYRVGGTITFEATPTLLDYWLPKILGAAESTDTFAVAETIPYFDLLIDRVTQRHVYANCKVNRATFSQSSGQPLQLSLDIIGQSETVSATAFPALTAPTDPPYAFHHNVSTIVSAAREIISLEVTIDNQMDVRFSNSQTATSIMPTDRNVTVRLVTPYTVTALYGQTLLGSAATLVWTNGNISTTMTFGKLQFPDESPNVANKQEITLSLSGVARKTGSTADIAVTHDSTP